MAITGAFAAGNEVVMQDCKIEVDLTPITTSAFADISSWTGEVAVSGGEVPTSNFFTFGTDGPNILTGNRDGYTVSPSVLYTEGATDPFQNLWDKYEDPTSHSDGYDCDVRWSPQGGATGDFQFTTIGGKLTMVPPPVNTAEGTDPTAFTFVIKCKSIERSEVSA